jgi:adenylylsulfate kinase
VIRKITVQRPFVLWLTGLPCSGKTTLAQALDKEFLQGSSRPLRILDGDKLRADLSKDLGFSREDRDTHNLRVAAKASEIMKSGDPVCVSLISPYRKTRQTIKEVTSNFVELYVKCPVEVCEKRDSKGMYKLARAGKIKMFTGVDDPYEEPLSPDIVVETDRQNINECVNTILNGLIKHGYIQCN